MSDDRGFDPRYDPDFQRGWDGPTAPATREAPRAADPERMVVAPERLPETEVPEDDEHRRRLNPFLIVLGAVSIALVVAGVWMASLVSDGFSQQGPSTQVDYAMLQVLMIGSPITVLLGVATAVGILFLLAARWGR